MKIKVLVIDPELSQRTTRRVVGFGLGAIVTFGGALAYANGLLPTTTRATLASADAGLPSFANGETLQAADLNAMSSAITALQSQIVPTGTVVAFAGPVAPAGWLLCDGSAKSRTTYAALFAAIGTSSGSGDGATTFNLPDYRGSFLRGMDDGAGKDPDVATRIASAAGGNVGDNVGSAEGASVQSHAHSITDQAHTHGVANGEWVVHTGSPAQAQYSMTSGAGVGVFDTAGTAAAYTGITETNAAGGAETRPYNVYVQFIIKV
jgi:microcystin-dependent protein